MYLDRRLCFLFCCLLLVTGGSSPSGAQIDASRMKDQVVETSRTVLRGNTLMSSRLGLDMGPGDPLAHADRMLLVLRRSAEKESALRSFLDSLEDPNSPNFRKFLTPDQFGSRFGVSESDVSRVTGWLKEHGFQVAGVNKGRTGLEFSGTIGQIQEAFQVPIRTYNLHGMRHWANAADPSIPGCVGASDRGSCESE